jgi:nitrilase
VRLRHPDHFAPTQDFSDSWLATSATSPRRAGLRRRLLHRHAPDEIPDRYEFKSTREEGRRVNGGNRHRRSDGTSSRSIFEKEDILYAEIDLASSRTPVLVFDAAGHYARPDVFQLTVNRAANPMIITNGNESIPSADGQARKPARQTTRRRS